MTFFNIYLQREYKDIRKLSEDFNPSESEFDFQSPSEDDEPFGSPRDDLSNVDCNYLYFN